MPNKTTALFILFSVGLLSGALGKTISSTLSIEKMISHCPDKIICEGYANGNWELFIMDADGGNLRNLTQTPDLHELYPQVSPNGTLVAFVSDVGEGRTKVRSVWIMSLKTGKRLKVADYAHQPFWGPKGKTLGYLPQEYKKFSVTDYSTKGIMFFDLKSKKDRPHPNSDHIEHLYNPGFSPDGKWIVATVHGGMGFQHADLLIEANGDQIIDLKVHGCRPAFSPNGKYLAWGATDHEIQIAPINWHSKSPSLEAKRFKILDKQNKIYHVAWAPNGKWVTLSRGPAGKGDPEKPGTIIAASEVVGVYATDWNLIAVAIQKEGTLDLNDSPDGCWVQLTQDGQSYKESEWIPAP